MHRNESAHASTRYYTTLVLHTLTEACIFMHICIHVRICIHATTHPPVFHSEPALAVGTTTGLPVLSVDSVFLPNSAGDCDAGEPLLL
jgi:hypothetical protein